MARQLSLDAICDLIDALLPGNYPSLEEVARLLSISPRSLQRALSETNDSYSDLVDHCRRKTACESLEQTQKPIREIAKKLGYRDASSFSRAFRRWTGTMPRAYRNQLIGLFYFNRADTLLDCFLGFSILGGIGIGFATVIACQGSIRAEIHGLSECLQSPGQVQTLDTATNRR